MKNKSYKHKFYIKFEKVPYNIIYDSTFSSFKIEQDINDLVFHPVWLKVGTISDSIFVSLDLHMECASE